LTMNVSGTGLSGSATFTADQAGGSTFTVTSNATSANTAGAIVARDGSGNFTAGTITAALSGNATTSSSTTGNAATATALQTARTINGVSFNGTENITVADATKLPLAGGTMTGLLIGRESVGTDVNTMNDAGSFSVRSNSSNAASISFHRTGAFAINMGLGTDNVFRIGGWSATANAFQMTSGGNLTMTGTITANSDERLKKDWSDLPADFVERLAQIKHGTYTRIDSGERQAGSSAQDWQKLLPEVVQTGSDEEKTLSLAYGNAALVSVVELAKVVIELKAEVQSLKAQLKG
jgi:hypothetical protein